MNDKSILLIAYLIALLGITYGLMDNKKPSWSGWEPNFQVIVISLIPIVAVLTYKKLFK